MGAVVPVKVLIGELAAPLYVTRAIRRQGLRGRHQHHPGIVKAPTASWTQGNCEWRTLSSALAGVRPMMRPLATWKAPWVANTTLSVTLPIKFSGLECSGRACEGACQAQRFVGHFHKCTVSTHIHSCRSRFNPLKARLTAVQSAQGLHAPGALCRAARARFHQTLSGPRAVLGCGGGAKSLDALKGCRSRAVQGARASAGAGAGKLPSLHYPCSARALINFPAPRERN
jgi:hypothetical protein